LLARGFCARQSPAPEAIASALQAASIEVDAQNSMAKPRLAPGSGQL
jgi:hypothetical protein